MKPIEATHTREAAAHDSGFPPENKEDLTMEKKLNIIGKDDLKKLKNAFNRMMNNIVALAALTETTKTAMEREDNPYTASVYGIYTYLSEIMEQTDSVISVIPD